MPLTHPDSVSVSFVWPARRRLADFAAGNERRLRRLAYLKKQSNYWVISTSTAGTINSFLAGIRQGRAFETWYWECDPSKHSTPPLYPLQIPGRMARFAV